MQASSTSPSRRQNDLQFSFNQGTATQQTAYESAEINQIMNPLREDEVLAKDLLYKAVKKHLDTLGKQIDTQNREIIWQSLVQELSQNEDILA